MEIKNDTDAMPQVSAEERSHLQAKLAAVLNVQVTTLQNWEQGEREPSGPAKKLLEALKSDPVNALKTVA